MPAWNPNNPTVVGLEWLVGRATFAPLYTPSQALTQDWRSTVAETITAMRIPTLIAGGDYAVEVYPQGQETAEAMGAWQSVSLVPTGGTTQVRVVNSDGGGTTNGWQRLGNDTRYVDFLPTENDDAYMDLGFTLGGALAGYRILGLEVRTRSKCIGGPNYIQCEVATPGGALVDDSTIGQVWPGTVGDVYETPTSGQWANTVFWTPGLVDGFDGSLFRLRLRVPAAPDNRIVRCSRVWLRPIYCLETRVAAGLVKNRVGLIPEYEPIPLLAPDMVNPWNKAAATDYTTVIRTLPDRAVNAPQALLQVARLDGNYMPQGGASRGAASGEVDKHGRVVGSTLTRTESNTYPSLLEVGGDPTAISIDTCGYSGIIPLSVQDGGWLQRVRGTDQTFGQVKVVASDLLSPTEDLGVAVTDDALNILAYGAFAVEDFNRRILAEPVGGGPWRQVTVDLNEPVTLTIGNTYYIWPTTKFDSPNHSWQVAALTVTPYPDGASEATYGLGSDLLATPSETFPMADMMATLITPTDPMGALSVEVTQQSVPNLACGPDGDPITMDFVRLRWESVPPEAEYVDIQRQDPTTGVWHFIGFMPSYRFFYDDHEARMGMTQRYRVRASRADGGFSAWSNEVQATPKTEALITFTSNTSPHLNCAYLDEYDRQGRRYQYNDEFVTHPLQNRNYQIAERGPEDRGLSFTRDLIVRMPPGYVGVNRFDRLRELARDPQPPYVCVREMAGGYFLAAIEVQASRMVIAPVRGGQDAISAMTVLVTETHGEPAYQGSEV